MLVFGLSFLAGCVAGATLSVWSLAILSTAAIMVGVVLAAVGVIGWHDVLGWFVFAVIMAQGGYLVSFLVQAAVRSMKPKTISSATGKETKETAY